MAKRRNPKKEKAQRNQAYARKFRKKKAGFFSKRFSSKFASGNNQNGNEQGAEEGAGAVEE
ncbi:hypothetical protein [Okeania sp.]|uniref:hypothetical protein n=1 Tax=Okeania sp. TaxID=3100323 RepID=UPI002B4B01D3|nr:hypothetical protein [Okeania sp.]MEB3341454.1 hypothetical protein [Okeania sp.]